MAPSVAVIEAILRYLIVSDPIVFVVGENHLPVVAPLNDVLSLTGQYVSRQTRHLNGSFGCSDRSNSTLFNRV
jgi:hypothetical protein